MKTDEKKIRYTVAKRKTGKEQQQQQQSLVSIFFSNLKINNTNALFTLDT